MWVKQLENVWLHCNLGSLSKRLSLHSVTYCICTGMIPLLSRHMDTSPRHQLARSRPTAHPQSTCAGAQSLRVWSKRVSERPQAGDIVSHSENKGYNVTKRSLSYRDYLSTLLHIPYVQGNSLRHPVRRQCSPQAQNTDMWQTNYLQMYTIHTPTTSRPHKTQRPNMWT